MKNKATDDTPETEWVLPTHIEEKWTLQRFCEVFEGLPAGEEGRKRVLLATVGQDSTVVYYILHEGIVKPRQN
jgi:tRNA-splicing endonuclease subunit Sen15, fungi type